LRSTFLSGLSMEVAEQLQEGAYVVYIPYGILTRIAGYEWAGAYGDDKPKLVGYKLSCGISVELGSDIRRATAEEQLIHRVANGF